MFKALARFFGFKTKAKPEAYAPPPATKFPPASRPFADTRSGYTAESRDPQAERARGFERGRRNPEPAEPDPEPARPAAEDIRAAAEQHVPIDTSLSPEAICGITPSMSRAQISDVLARLYQRHNRASSSFDTQLAAEAEYMLDLIAGLREKYLSRPPGE